MAMVRPVPGWTARARAARGFGAAVSAPVVPAAGAGATLARASSTGAAAPGAARRARGAFVLAARPARGPGRAAERGFFSLGIRHLETAAAALQLARRILESHQ